MSADLYLELNDGGLHHLGNVQLNEDVLSNLRRWADGQEFSVDVVGVNSGGTSTLRASEINAFTFRREATA